MSQRVLDACQWAKNVNFVYGDIRDKKLLDEWQTMLSNMESGKTDKEKLKNNKTIKKKIAERFSIKEAINNLKD